MSRFLSHRNDWKKRTSLTSVFLGWLPDTIRRAVASAVVVLPLPLPPPPPPPALLTAAPPPPRLVLVVAVAVLLVALLGRSLPPWLVVLGGGRTALLLGLALVGAAPRAAATALVRRCACGPSTSRITSCWSWWKLPVLTRRVCVDGTAGPLELFDVIKGG